MIFRIKLRLVVLSAVVLTVLAVPACADHFIKQVTTSDPVTIMGQTMPGSSDTSAIWMTEGKSCMLGPDGSRVLYIEAEKMLYQIDPSTKTYSKVFVDYDEMMGGEEEAMTEEEKAEMRTMQEQMMGSIDVTVTPTGETKKIGKWNTSKYIATVKMAMGTTTQEIWATEDIKIDFDMFMSVADADMAMMPGYEKMLAEWKKIKGIQVYSVIESSMMGTKTRMTMELLEYNEKKAPAGIFEIPEDYEKIDLMPMDMGE